MYNSNNFLSGAYFLWNLFRNFITGIRSRVFGSINFPEHLHHNEIQNPPSIPFRLFSDINSELDQSHTAKTKTSEIS